MAVATVRDCGDSGRSILGREVQSIWFGDVLLLSVYAAAVCAQRNSEGANVFKQSTGVSTPASTDLKRC